jgi:hypothetical protein
MWQVEKKCFSADENLTHLNSINFYRFKKLPVVTKLVFPFVLLLSVYPAKV